MAADTTRGHEASVVGPLMVRILVPQPQEFPLHHSGFDNAPDDQVQILKRAEFGQGEAHLLEAFR
jgi:hypothetical protein